ncbi:MAG: 6-bladed beta-propeller [Thermodesulfovibrionales bacterium]|nr:6-bladed beta-propeller [Thermodesulfovibrionales bacterium]
MIFQGVTPQRILSVLCLALMATLFACTTTSPTVPDKPTGEYIWPSPPATPRIKWITQWSNRYDFGKPSDVMEFLIGKERVERLRRPNGIVTDTAGNVYVADSEAHVVFVFDQEKKALRFLGLGRLGFPVGVAIDNKRGIIYVSDSKFDKVFGFDKNSDDVKVTFGGPSEFKNPSGMVYDEQRERLYIADTQNHLVKAFDSGGRHLFTIGKRGMEDGEFNFPSYVALDKTGKIYVVDSFNFRIQVFDPDGKYIRKFGKLGDASGAFSRPAGIGVDSDGNIHIVDTAFNNFQIFNIEGRLLLWIGTTGKKPGEFYLPTGLYIDNQDKIYVSDTYNQRVQVFQYLKTPK